MARAGRAAYRKAVVAAPRRLKQLGGGFDGVVWISRPLGVELHHDELDHVPVRPALDPPVQFLQLLGLCQSKRVVVCAWRDTPAPRADIQAERASHSAKAAERLCL